MNNMERNIAIGVTTVSLIFGGCGLYASFKAEVTEREIDALLESNALLSEMVDDRNAELDEAWESSDYYAARYADAEERIDTLQESLEIKDAIISYLEGEM